MIYLKIKGKKALFARPELRAERFSYEVPTVSAMLGLLKAIYWKPEMEYHIHKIYVINKPKFENVKTNAQTGKIRAQKVEKFLTGQSSDGDISIKRKDEYTPRTMHILKDVEYVLEFSMDLTGKGTHENDCNDKHAAIFLQRVKKGQCFKHLCLGAKEFTCDVGLIEKEDIPKSHNRGKYPLGNMFYSMDYSGAHPKPIFKRLVMRNGVIDTDEVYENKGGWLFEELLQFYEDNADAIGLAKEGYSREKIHFEAVLDSESNMIAFNPLNVSDKGKILPYMMLCPEAVTGRTIGKKANFLWDNESYVFGMEPKSDETGREKKRLFIEKLKAVNESEESKQLQTVIKFLKEHSEMEMILPYIEKYEKNGALGGNITFRMKDSETYVFEDPVVRRLWKEYSRNHAEGKIGKCIVTGEKDVICNMHPTIKGVSGANAFAKLVSIDKASPAFECYGMTGMENSAFGKSTTFRYVTALNWLLSNLEHNIKIGDYSFVIWSDTNNLNSLSRLKHLLTGYENEGEEPFIEGETFCILVMKANSSRLVVESFDRFVYGESDDKIKDFLLEHLYMYHGTNCNVNWNFVDEWENNKMVSSEKREFLLGSLFAVLEKAQKDAVPSTKTSSAGVASNIEKASLTPAKVFPKLLSMSVHHTNKKDYGSRKKIEEIMISLDEFEEPFPDRFTEKERGTFFIGYYKTKNSLYKKKEDT